MKQSKRQRDNVLWHHEQQLNHLGSLQTTALPEKERLLRKLKTEPGPRKQWGKIKRLEKAIKELKSHDDELLYVSSTKRIVDDYVKMENDDQPTTTTTPQITTRRDVFSGFIKRYDNVNKEKLANEYFRTIGKHEWVDDSGNDETMSETFFCDGCGCELISKDGFMTCPSCGVVSDKLMPEYPTGYKEIRNVNIKTQFSYKRINRFNEVLSSLQGKENTTIPQKVIESVSKEIRKEKNADMTDITEAKVKYYLKRLNMANYYEHSPSILARINPDYSPVSIPEDVEEQLRSMFVQIQEPFEVAKRQVCPERSSFLSYHYVLFKFCELIGMDDLKKSFPLLKSAEKLRVQDAIWKVVCEQLGWYYYPSG